MKHLVQLCVMFLLVLGLVPGAALAQTLKVSPFETSGNVTLDKALYSEAVNLSSVFGVTPTIYILDDNQALNATSSCSDYMILLGLGLLREEARRPETGGLSVAGIMAHEFAHMYQCHRTNVLDYKDTELQADYLAGWYMRSSQLARDLEMTNFLWSRWARVGDYDINNPQHHGTPEERVQAMAAGFSDKSRSVAAAYLNSLSYLKTSVMATSIPVAVPVSEAQICTRPTACVHAEPCQHERHTVVVVECGHLVPCQHFGPCQHVFMTADGPKVAHAHDPLHDPHPMHETDIADRYEPEHPHGHVLHDHDTEWYVCGQ